MWYLFLFALLLGADQLMKHWTVTQLALGESAPLLPGVMQLTRVHNYGAAWSSFSGYTTLLIVVTVLLMGAIGYLLLRRIVRHPLGLVACTLVLAGGVGNLIDRLLRGYVVDMLDLQLFSYPVFNFADCCVVVGAILGGVYYLFLYEKHDGRKKEPKDGTDTDPGDE